MLVWFNVKPNLHKEQLFIYWTGKEGRPVTKILMGICKLHLVCSNRKPNHLSVKFYLANNNNFK